MREKSHNAVALTTIIVRKKSVGGYLSSSLLDM